MTAPMSDARLDEIQALADAATPGPWAVAYDHDDTPYDVKFPSGIGPFTCIEHPAPYDDADAEFVSAARIAVPELLAEVRRAQAAEARVLELHHEVAMFGLYNDCDCPDPDGDGKHEDRDGLSDERLCGNNPLPGICGSCEQEWPCATARALGEARAELAAKEA